MRLQDDACTGGTNYEGQTVSQAHVRKMQGHPPQGPGYGDLPGSETQTETGLIVQPKWKSHDIGMRLLRISMQVRVIPTFVFAHKASKDR